MLSIDHLPPEILAEIGIFFAHEAFHPPIQLLYVCRAWRDTLLCSPPCWSALSIRCSSDPSCRSIPIITSWIDRSRLSPLFLSLDFGETDERPVPLLQPSASVLPRQRGRMSELVVSDVSGWHLWNLVHLWPAPNLRSFALVRHHDGRRSSPFLPPLELLEFPLFLRDDPQAPALATLYLTHCRLLDPPRCELSAVGDLSLLYTSSSLPTLRRTLASTPNVLRLELGPVGIEPDSSVVGTAHSSIQPPPPPPRLSLKHVWSMKIQLEVSSIPLLDHLLTPSLTHLTLAATVTRSCLDTISTFLAQTHLPISYLGITLIGSYSVHGLALILPALPTLQTLHVSVRHVSFHPLAVTNQSSLETFKIQFEPPPKSTRHWEELFYDQPDYQVSGKLFPDRQVSLSPPFVHLTRFLAAPS